MNQYDWNIYRCHNMACIQVGHDLRVDSGINNPHCAICGDLLSKIDVPTMEPVCPIQDDDEPWPEEDGGDEDDVNEWMRCRDGIDNAEIALKGFCDEIGADVTKGRIQEICRSLQDLVHTHYGMGD